MEKEWLTKSFFFFYNKIGDKMKKIIIVLTIFILTACSNSNDYLKFKTEYEKLNNSLHKIEISEDNYMKYSSIEEIIKIIEEGTGVIYIGNEHDNECRQMVPILISAADSTNIEEINYLRTIELDEFSKYIDSPQVPLVLFVYEGKIVNYKQGIGNNENLTQIESEELFNTYVDGIHKVLNDMCNEECDD